MKEFRTQILSLILSQYKKYTALEINNNAIANWYAQIVMDWETKSDMCNSFSNIHTEW